MPLGSACARFCLPQHDPDDTIELPAYPIYQPRIPKQPTSPLCPEGLRDRIQYGRKMTAIRNISPRFKAFLNDWKERCKDVLHAKGSRQEQNMKLQRLAAADGMLQSRYDEVHGPNGLCDALVKSIARYMERRLRIAYGDYLARGLSKLKDDRFAGFQWPEQPALNLDDVAKHVEEELKAINAIPTRWNTKTPWLDDVGRAARILNIDRAQMIFEIKAYAGRNQLCHWGLKRMIDEADFIGLATQICNDKQILDLVFGIDQTTRYNSDNASAESSSSSSNSAASTRGNCTTHLRRRQTNG
ncbi:MAG: hypothetical protein M1816_006850 [Peltula sp. TS41687]|nr:MAG: hypothetical protein M1816_006850 [Peltula sp. TS41687]